jgi:hypothetical protein
VAASAQPALTLAGSAAAYGASLQLVNSAPGGKKVTLCNRTDGFQIGDDQHVYVAVSSDGRHVNVGTNFTNTAQLNIFGGISASGSSQFSGDVAFTGTVGASLQLTNSAPGGKKVTIRNTSDGFQICDDQHSYIAVAADGTHVNIGTNFTNTAELNIFGGISASGDAKFDGNVIVNGDVILSSGADCAEDFDVITGACIEPGTVLVLGEAGSLGVSQKAYDRCVAGIVSGAGDYKPGLTLDRRESRAPRVPIALIGKVYCKVDADYAPIDIGDLLTTSATPGHAMNAKVPTRAFGAVIGKALRPLRSGKGLIPVLVALQ